MRLTTEPGGIATISLDNPRSRNALTGVMMCQLADHVTQLEAQLPPPGAGGSELVGLVLRGEGGTFCAGADLRFAAQELQTSDDGALMSALMNTTLLRLRKLPLISVAAIDGYAVGGGAELATATDFRVLSADAVVRFVQVKMGVTPGWGGGGRLTSIVGRKEALRLLGSGVPAPASDALAVGLADHVAPPGVAAASAAAAFLAPYTQQANPAAVRVIKSVVSNADVNTSCDDDSGVVVREAALFEQMWGANPLPDVDGAKANAKV